MGDQAAACIIVRGENTGRGRGQFGGEDNGFCLGGVDSRVFVEPIGSTTGLEFRLELPFGELST